MAAKVGSVFVDVVANTAEFQAQMKQAADATHGLGGLVTEKAYKAAQAQDKAGAAAARYAEASRRMEMSIGGAASAMAMQMGLTTSLSGGVFRLGEYMARLSAEARRAAEAQQQASAAMGGGTSAAAMMAQSLAGVVVRLGAIALAVKGIDWALGAWGRETERLKQAQDALRAQMAQIAREDADAAKGRKQTVDELVAGLESGKEKLSGFWDRFRQLQAEEAAKAAADAARQGERIAGELAREIEARGNQMGVDLVSGEAVDEWTRRVNQIQDAYEDMEQKAAEIADAELRRAALSDLGVARARELVVLRRQMADAAGVDSEKQRAEWLGRARDAAREIAASLRQAAGIVLGRGADAWRAVQDAARVNRSEQLQRTLMDRSGASAIDEASRRNLQDMRDYLFALVNAETVPL